MIDPDPETLRRLQWPRKVAHLFGTRVAEPILASVHVRARQHRPDICTQAIRSNYVQIYLRDGGRPHMQSGRATGMLELPQGRRIRVRVIVRCSSARSRVPLGFPLRNLTGAAVGGRKFDSVELYEALARQIREVCDASAGYLRRFTSP